MLLRDTRTRVGPDEQGSASVTHRAASSALRDTRTRAGPDEQGSASVTHRAASSALRDTRTRAGPDEQGSASVAHRAASHVSGRPNLANNRVSKNETTCEIPDEVSVST
ncbi:hypothetical protein Atai01_12540 [Amycolatopsis taiwanensis]|uniref:Uncharacterized protein n=1 Tax=Amycolatopsis taiwanensis TaxID=342230 RepID=A0A9W6QXC6_9PSEU|nr:hypothetical protein Atai01_12540 [Amycolatopsis taiwanensis]